MMSELDLNKVPEAKKNDISVKSDDMVPCNGTCGNDVAKGQMHVISGLVSYVINDKNPPEVCTAIGNAEVEYVESEDLKDVEDVDCTMKKLTHGLNSSDWYVVCESLNNVRRLSIFHMEAMRAILYDVLPLIVKSLKNPRSGVCKTAIMASADLFRTYNDSIIDSLDPLLMQLLLKASQDKKFVCEAAERSLILLTHSVSPMLLLPKLQPYLQNKNPRIRARASLCYSRSVPRLGVEGVQSYGIDKLIQVAASQLSDQLPESREAARALLQDLQTMYEKSNALAADANLKSWEQFCHLNLSPLNAQAVLRVTNIAREPLILGS